MKKVKAIVTKDLAELEETTGIVEIYGRRGFWVRCGRNKSFFYTMRNCNAGKDVIIYDMRMHKFLPVSQYKDTRRTSKYYYDWGEIDRLIYKYFYEKHKYRATKKSEVLAKDLPDHIIAIRNQIIESLFNLVNTIIYTHSFHQQMHDGDLFQDSVEKLIKLLDDDKHDPVRGTSFTFFTIALKNMIFTQLKKNKRYAISTDNIKPGKNDSRTDFGDDYDIPVDMGFEKDMFDIYNEALSADRGEESEYPYNDELEKEFSEE